MTMQAKPGPVALRGLDHGQIPPALKAQQERIAALTSNNPAPTRPASVSDATVESRKDEIESPTEPVHDPAPPPARSRHEKVELTYVPHRPDYPSFKMTFNVGEVCFREHYVSMLIVSDLGFKPTATMNFDLSYRGVVTPVVFAGAEFEFQTVGVRGISFLIDKQRAKAQQRSNGSEQQ